MNIRKYIVILILPLFFGLGCKSKHEGTAGSKLKKRSSKYIFGKVDKYHLDATWFSAKSNVKIVQNNKTIRAVATIRMKEDSVIWMSAKKFGFEGGRILITRDSFFMINRLEKSYIAEPFSYIRNMTGLSSTGDNLSDFRNLYDLILGNVILKTEEKYDVEIKVPHYHMKKEADGLASEYVISGNNFTLAKMKFSQSTQNKTAVCTFEGYKSMANDKLFSYIRNLNLYSRETGQLDLEMEFSKVKFDEPVGIQFSIPKHYEKAD